MIPVHFSWSGGAWGAGSWGAGAPLPPPPGSRAVGITGNACTLMRDLGTGELVLPIQFIRGPAAIAQGHWEALHFYQGEHFADTRLGLPWYQAIQGRNSPVALINNMYRKALLKVRGTVSIDSMESVLNRETRVLSTRYTATLDDGTILTAVEEPYIVTGDIAGRSF